MSHDRILPPFISRWIPQGRETPVDPIDPLHTLAQEIRSFAIPDGQTKGVISTAVGAFQREHPMQTISIGAGKIGDYLSFGEGDKVLVMLPGIVESPYGHVYDAVIQGYRVIIPDFTTFQYPQVGTHEEFVATFRTNLDRFITGIAGNTQVTLGGVSLGGLLVQDYLAHEHIAAVEKRVLIQTAALGAPVFSKGFLHIAGIVSERVSGQRLRGAFRIRRGGADAVITNHISQEHDETIVRDFIAYAMRHYRRRMTPEQLETTRHLALYFKYMPQDEATRLRRASPQMDTLLIDNRQDNVFPPQRSNLRQAYPHANHVDLDSPRKHRSSWHSVRQIATSMAALLIN